MTTIWTRIYLLGSALGVTFCLVLISLTIWLQGQPHHDLNRVNIKEEYTSQLSQLEQSLKSVSERDLSSADLLEVIGLQQKLLNLRVPGDAKEFHLAIVIKLKQLQSSLENEAGRQASAVSKLQTDLRQLLAENKW